jgi:serine/threonine-protein kinase PpkA
MDKLPVIPGCKVIKKLGHGGMASVYLGVQETLGREVAIKVMIPALFMDESFAKRFVKEAKIAARLVHPNIITVHDVGRAEDFYYIIMEYLEESLHDRIKRMGLLAPGESLEIVKKLAGALEYAHNKGIIHRDIKPDNIMFRFDNTPILVDFGIARAMDSSTKLTQSGMNIGTPYYMSTEQCEGKKIDGRSDIYSLGIALYEMLTGSIPYKAESPVGIILKHIRSPVPTLPAPLSQLQPLIDKMMAKQRENRVQTGKELRKLIDSIFKSGLFPESSTGTTPIQAETPVLNYPREQLDFPAANSSILRPGKKKWPWKAVTATLLVVLAALAIYLLILRPRNSIDPGNQLVNNKQDGKITE